MSEVDYLRKFPIIGIRYNGIRRSAHKTPEAMMEKIGKDLAAGRGDEWFSRWKVKISPADVAKFRRECLDPILEQLCDWWEFVRFRDPAGLYTHEFSGIHWRHPFGVYNVLDEGGSSDLDSYLETGSELGLQRGGSLFPELE